MIKKLVDRAAGWWSTLVIKYRNPGLYAFLKNYEFDPDDFEEVPGSGMLIHKNALENLRKLGEENQGR